ncbi:MAG TPA: alpha/beta hydrolase [Verrucomicrobiota bacterium]|nr:alpha/beta hydrolase [Verrucomicrobiota bacterium]HPU56165.1 alpha/beta hydrolase [Verrucomicrobiota bacterium]
MGFTHVFLPGISGNALLLLHGTGGNESDLLPLGRLLDPTAALLSPRGKVLENGMPRFFRRLAEGVFDEADLIQRTHELADFVEQAAWRHGLDRKRLLAVGYSNGANIAGALLLLRPGTIAGAALLRPMVPLVPDPLPDLGGAPVLVAAGNQDPIVPVWNLERLVDLLKRAGASVNVFFEEAGHGLTDRTVEVAKQWIEEIRRTR